MACEGVTNNVRSGKEDVDDLLKRLDLHEEGDDFVWEDEVEMSDVQAKWLVTTRFHTSEGFSPSSLYSKEVCLESSRGSSLASVRLTCSRFSLGA